MTHNLTGLSHQTPTNRGTTAKILARAHRMKEEKETETGSVHRQAFNQ